MPTIKHGYFVLYYEFTNKEDMKVGIRELRQMGIKASLISFSGHGSPATLARAPEEDRKSTRLNSSHQIISYAVFCLKKKKCHQPERRGCACVLSLPMP